MQDNNSLAVIIPVYNEENTIEEMVKDLWAILENEKINYTIFLMNDGSTDNTSALLANLKSSNNNINIITKPNSGHGPSVYYGYTLAEKFDWIFQTDGDYQYELESFVILWNRRNEYDILFGKRELKHASTARNIISGVTCMMVKLLFGKTLNDINVPFRLMKTSALINELKNVNATTFAPNVLLSALFLHKKYKIFITPLSARNKTLGRKSKAGKNIILGSFYSFFDLVKLRFKI